MSVFLYEIAGRLRHKLYSEERASNLRSKVCRVPWRLRPKVFKVVAIHIIDQENKHRVINGDEFSEAGD